MSADGATAAATAERTAAARLAAVRTRRNFFADGALAIASGAALLIVLAVLTVILFDTIRYGTPHLSLSFLTQAPREGMTEGGIFPAIIGMVEMVILMTLAGVPIGVATAIYLHEYASPVSLLTRAIRIAVANLAGVPSIVFGLFGLGFFVQFLGAGIDKAFFHGEKVFGQPALLWAALTMAVLMPLLPKGLSSQFMSPSYHVYVLSTQSPDVDATKPILYATVLVLLGLTFTLNIAAVVVRARMRRRAGVAA